MLLLAAMLSQGCAAPGARLQYLIGDEKTLEHYNDYSTAIEYPAETEIQQTDPNLFRAPRAITSLDDVEQRPIRVEECVRIALSNATILREDQNFGSPGNPLLANPARVASVYDSAIQETGFLFGNRGREAALSDFDTIFTNSMQWGRSEDPQNSPNLGIPAGGVLVDETAQWQARLEKSLASSGNVAVEHAWNYSQNNNTRMFPSAYTGYIQAEYRQPLLAGSGADFTRIAGPLSQGVRGVSGVSQGLLISRINSDISLLEFEQSVTTLVRDVENRYWDLYLAMQLYHSEVETFKDLVKYRDRLYLRDLPPDVVLQSENRLYEADARMKGSLGDVLSAEYRLRRLLGLPLNDGTFLTPIDRPTEAQLIPSWESSLMESLSNRLELRRQKWEIRSLELQLQAAKNLARPRMDFVSQYRVNGFGDNLLGKEDDDGVTDAGYASAYESLTQGNNTGWQLGVQFAMPIGLRLARAQVRNYELRLRKARTVLQAQEQEIAFELNEAIVKMDQWYLLATSGAKRADVAVNFSELALDRLESEALEPGRDDRRNKQFATEIERVVNAKITSRDADQGYLRSIVEYNKAITDLNFRKGTLLQANSIYLAEGQWNPGAYDGAKCRADAMTHALDNTLLESIPPDFVAGPAPNSWESLGNPNRPHVPGTMTGPAPQQSPSRDVPPIPNVPLQESIDPLKPNPNDTPDMPPGTTPRKKIDKVYEATDLGREALEQMGDTVGDAVRRVNFMDSRNSAPKPSSAGKAKMSKSGKATMR